MDVRDILQRYASGKRDFQGIDLSEANFQGADLADADFSGCDLRGTNFARANLTGARFRGTRMGLPIQWAILLGAIALGLTIAIALVTGYCLGVLTAIFGAYNPPSSLLWTVRGLTIAVLYFPLALALACKGRFSTYSLATVAVTIASALAATGLLLAMVPEGESGIFLVVLFAVAIATAIAVALVGAVVDATPILVANAVVGILAAAIGSFLGIYGAAYSSANASALFVAVVSLPVLVLLLGLLLSFYPGSSTFQNKGREPLLHTLILTVATAIAGTRFTQANLTDADFSGAALQNVNFKKAILTGASFQHARQLHGALYSAEVTLDRQ